MPDELNKVVIPLGKQRTNVWDPLRPTLRSVNIGAYTTRGIGVTKQTEEWPSLVKCLHKVAKYRPKDMRLPYTSISLNQLSRLSSLRIHKDSRNSHLPSCVIAFGEYEGGEFWVEDPAGTHHPTRSAIKEPWQASLKGLKIDVKNRFVKFDPRAWHCIYPLGEAEWNTLEKCGFNAGLTSDQVISAVRAAFGELTDRDAYLEILHQIDDTLHEISEHHDLDLKPDAKHPKLDPIDKERHEREGHLPKDSSCPACIRESGSR
eukprot:3360360-Amphidinium_carterae.1